MNKKKEKEINPKLLFIITVVCLFLVGKAFFGWSAGVVCDNSGGELFKHNSSIVCVIKDDLDACIDFDGNVKKKTWVDDLNITYDWNISEVS